MVQTGQKQSSIDYWEDYYKKYTHTEPSLFARFLINEGYVEPGNSLVDLCCGDGRDTLFLNERVSSVIGVDGATLVKEECVLRGDIVDYMDKNLAPDVTYCRFGLHVVEEHIEDKILSWSNKLCVECRSDVGEKPPDTHFRRYINAEAFLLKVLAAGYRVKYFVHSTGLSPTPQRDPFLIRLVGEK